jgi:hypothetical protein
LEMSADLLPLCLTTEVLPTETVRMSNQVILAVVSEGGLLWVGRVVSGLVCGSAVLCYIAE